MATRRTILLGMGAAGLSLTACAGPRGRGRPGGGRGGGSSARDPDQFSRGLEHKHAGDLDEAIRYFAQVAGMGAGYEVAQFHLGDCFLRQGDAVDDEGEIRQKFREGAFWISLAAQSGEVNAQARMAGLYFDGKGVAQDLAEAGTYVLLAEGNLRAEFTSNGSLAELSRVRDGLSADDWAEAERRAAEFIVLKQTSRNFPIMRREGRSRPSGGRGDGGGRGGGGRGGGRRGADEETVDG